jgi:hypothetical protein
MENQALKEGKVLRDEILVVLWGFFLGLEDSGFKV